MRKPILVEKGFTIMELMIVVAIVGVLGAVALPGLRDWNRNANRTAAVTEMLGSLHLARSEAVKRNVRVGMCPTSKATDPDAQCEADKDWSIGWLVFVDDNGDMFRDADEEVIGAIDAIHTSFSLYSTGGDTALDFRPNGRLETNNAADEIDFNVCDDRGPEQGRVVSVTKSGRPQSGLTQQNGDKPNC